MKNDVLEELDNKESLKPLRPYIYIYIYINGSLKKERIQGYDIARSFAILCVVLCHSVEMAYSNVPYLYLGQASQIFRIIFFTIGRLGVPIFLFLTGALTLKKQIDTDEDVLRFYKKNLIPLLITIEIWNVLYNLFLSIMNKNFSFNILLENLFFLKQVDISNMWYMPMILGMYIAIPFIAKVVKNFSVKTIKIPILFIFLSSFFLPSINVILYNIHHIAKYNLIIDLSFLGGEYGLYILFGYYISEGVLKNIQTKFLLLIFIISYVFTVFIQYYAIYNGVTYNVWYNFITILICTICIFELFRRAKKLKNKKIGELIKYISQISLGIFFMHEIVLKLFGRVMQLCNLINPIKTIIFFIVTFVVSTILINLLSNLKFIKEKVFLIKE